MRKITLYLSLLLTFLGVTTNEALAQVSCVDLVNDMSVGDSKTVIMHVGGTNVNKFIGTFSGSGNNYYNDGKDNLNATVSEYKYTITKKSETTITVKDSHDKYIPGYTSQTGQFTNNSTTEVAFTFEAVTSPVNPINSSATAYTLTYSVDGGASI